MFTKIAVPLDRSELAERVFPALAELARALGSEIHMVGVCQPGVSDEQLVYQDYLDRQAAQLVRNLAGSAATVRTAVILGTSAERILEYVEAEAVDLVVMSSRGRSGMNRWSLGRTVDKVLRRIHVPLLVIRTRQQSDGERVFSRIAVPLDGSTRSAAVLPTIRELADRVGCEIFLVEVVEVGIHVRTIGGLDYVPFKERDTDTARASASEYLREVSTDLSRNRVRVSYEVRTGQAAREIHAFADEKRCTLITMCSYRNSRMEAWVMGRVATKVLEHSSQSVWLVPWFASD